MQSNNPIFTRSAEFNGRGGAVASDPSQWQVDLSGSPTHTERGAGRMTIDTVVEKTAITLGLVVAAAAVAWVVIGEIVTDTGLTDDSAVSKAYALTLVGGLGGFALVMINAFKKVTSPPLVIGYAVLEGLFVGAFSKLITTFVSADASIIFGAVLGTFAAVAGTLGLLTLAAAITWFVIPDLNTGVVSDDDAAFGTAATLAGAGAILGLGLSLVNSFKKIISPALVLAYAVVEGVFIGAFSKIISTFVGDASIVFQAVLGTVIAFFGTLAAYKFFNIQVTDRFRKIVTIAMFSVVGVLLVNMVLSLTGVFKSGGLRGFDTLGLLVSCALVVLAVFMLIMDFDYVEQGVAAGLPERESWRAAFGLTVTLVWLYIEILRILAILRGD